MKKVLITGAYGLIGRAIAERFSSDHKIIFFDKKKANGNYNSGIAINGDITDTRLIQKVCNTHTPDIVVHCAGIAHQAIASPIDENAYDQVNFLATKALAMAAAKANLNVHFIFLSSVSVYGEDHDTEVRENVRCCPESCYAVSKLRAEKSLKKLYEDNTIKKLDILRLSPVYDRHWTVNIDKRVFGPGKLFYSRFGNGLQKISILSRQNLVDFIGLLIDRNDKTEFCHTYNVCDQYPCTFNEIIRIFQASKYQPDRRVIQIPLGAIKILTLLTSLIFKNKAALFNSFYKKLANDLVFDNRKMLETGFKPRFSLEIVFKNEI